jgi:hypothetical protein
MDINASKIKRRARDPGSAGRPRPESAVPPKQETEGNNHADLCDFQSKLSRRLLRPFKSLFDPFMRLEHELE